MDDVSTAPDLVLFRPAGPADLDALIALFAADTLGGHGDTTDPRARPAYAAALTDILASPNAHLIVCEIAGRVVATAQLTLTRTLTHRGRLHASIEAVQVARDRRGGGIGARMIAHLLDLARAEGAGIVGLTSNAARLDAHRFYERLGFVRSHLGFKLLLAP
jgi:GNAT superfamily N-acetyltransferase